MRFIAVLDALLHLLQVCFVRLSCAGVTVLCQRSAFHPPLAGAPLEKGQTSNLGWEGADILQSWGLRCHVWGTAASFSWLKQEILGRVWSQVWRQDQTWKMLLVPGTVP